MKALITIRRYLSNKPIMFVLMYRAFGRNKNLLVSKNTDIVIEGYPRSGNTFSVLAFQYAQKKEITIAHHLHAAAQVIWAIKKSIPVVVLIRTPIEAVVSFVIRDEHVSIDEAIDEYIKFYESILPYKNDVVIGEFELVTNDYGKIIESINKKYNLNYLPFKHTVSNQEEVFKMVQHVGKNESNNILDERKVARPSDERSVIKTRLMPQILSEKYCGKINKANDIYTAFTTKSNQN
ncbi:MAG: hypothetical protein AB2603_00740 [Candidatus Thiodiazotropha endolucinida]